MNNQSFSHEQVSKVAHRLWEKAGRPDGYSEQHWQQAVEELQQPKPKARKPSATKLSDIVPKSGKKPASKAVKPIAAKARAKVAKR